MEEHFRYCEKKFKTCVCRKSGVARCEKVINRKADHLPDTKPKVYPNLDKEEPYRRPLMMTGGPEVTARTIHERLYNSYVNKINQRQVLRLTYMEGLATDEIRKGSELLDLMSTFRIYPRKREEYLEFISELEKEAEKYHLSKNFLGYMRYRLTKELYHAESHW